MGRARAHADARGWALLVSVVGAALVLALPSLLITTPDAAGSIVALAVLVLGLATLAQYELRSVTHTSLSALSTEVERAPVLTGRVTDPVHHPLRPRAPGLA